MTEPADQPTEERPGRRMVDLPAAELPPRTVVVQCVGCEGHGKVQMSVHDVLGESIALIQDHADDVVRRFYKRLFTLAPAISGMFPKDLLTAPAHAEGSPGAHQRDMLVGALVKVATLYGAGEREERELDTVLRQAGRSHASFAFPGEDLPRPAGPDEYALVKRALFETLTEVAGNLWRPEYTKAWGEAYDYAATEMQHASNHEGRHMTHARQTRLTAEQGGGRDWKP